MTFEKIDMDGKPRYVKKKGGIVHLSKDKNGALDDVPEGWKVIRRKSGKLSIIMDN